MFYRSYVLSLVTEAPGKDPGRGPGMRIPTLFFPFRRTKEFVWCRCLALRMRSERNPWMGSRGHALHVAGSLHTVGRAETWNMTRVEMR